MSGPGKQYVQWKSVASSLYTVRFCDHKLQSMRTQSRPKQHNRSGWATERKVFSLQDLQTPTLIARLPQSKTIQKTLQLEGEYLQPA